MNFEDKYKVLEKKPKPNTEYMSRQRSIKLMQAGYAEKNLDKKVDDIKYAQAMANVELNEVEAQNPMLMISRGYQALNEINKPEETEIQFHQEHDAAIDEVDEYLTEIAKLGAKLDAYKAKLEERKE